MTQPLPAPPTGDVVLLDLLELTAERTRAGLESYGQLLRTANGRDDAQDFVEECFDALLYALVLRRNLRRGIMLSPEFVRRIIVLLSRVPAAPEEAAPSAAEIVGYLARCLQDDCQK